MPSTTLPAFVAFDRNESDDDNIYKVIDQHFEKRSALESHFEYCNSNVFLRSKQISRNRALYRDLGKYQVTPSWAVSQGQQAGKGEPSSKIRNNEPKTSEKRRLDRVASIGNVTDSSRKGTQNSNEKPMRRRRSITAIINLSSDDEAITPPRFSKRHSAVEGNNVKDKLDGQVPRAGSKARSKSRVRQSQQETNEDGTSKRRHRARNSTERHSSTKDLIACTTTSTMRRCASPPQFQFKAPKECPRRTRQEAKLPGKVSGKMDWNEYSFLLSDEMNMKEWLKARRRAQRQKVMFE